MGAGQQRVLQFAGKRRAIARRIRGQLSKTCAEGTASSEKDPEEDCHNVAHGSRSRIEGKASSESSCRGDEEDSHRTAHSCQRTGPQEVKDKACHDEFLWSHSSARRRKSREKSLACSPGNAPCGHADASWTKTGGETCCVQQHGTGSQIRNAQKLGACTATVFLLNAQEPCTREALKVMHQSLVYLEEIAEISPAARLTVRPRCSNLLAELLSQTKPGAEPRQAPRPSRQSL